MSQLPDPLDHVLNDLADAGVVRHRDGEPKEGSIVQMFTFKDFTTGQQLFWNADLANKLVGEMDPSARTAATLHTDLGVWYDAVVRPNKHNIDADYVASMRRKDLDRPALAVRMTAEMIPGIRPDMIGNAVIIDGNHRMARAHGLGWPTYPVVVLPADLEQKCRVNPGMLAMKGLALGSLLNPSQINIQPNPAP